jgi:ornithine cyclodeaminase/alanine dehydrogenase-like protein (mu-crystallin family)
MDSAEITRLRTAAASAVAARYLARDDATIVTLCGCGVQGEAHLRALARVRPLSRAFVFDVDAARAEALARALGPEPGFSVSVVRDLAAAARASDIVVTTTPSTSPILGVGHVAPGAFIAAVGADNPHKQEIAPELLARATIVTDLTSQAVSMGDLHHAIDAGVVTAESVHAELGEVVAGRVPGRRAADEIIVFDSTGMALQDVAAAARTYERAVAGAGGTRLRLGD